MDIWIQFTLTILGSILASSGLWTFFTKRSEKKDTRTEMLIGLAHDRIMSLGIFYIERGWMTSDEYENLYNYLFEPYSKLGGNGSAARVMKEVDDKVEIRSVPSAVRQSQNSK